jgi:hypothetical protein
MAESMAVAATGSVDPIEDLGKNRGESFAWPKGPVQTHHPVAEWLAKWLI